MTENSTKRIRTCIACGERSDKVELLRIVRTKEGNVCFDAKGNMPGRGAYVCSVACFEKAASKGLFKRALKCNVSGEDLTVIAEVLERAHDGALSR